MLSFSRIFGLLGVFILLTSPAALAENPLDPELDVLTEPAPAISMQHFRHAVTTLAPVRRDHRWVGTVRGRPVNEVRFYEAAGAKDLVKQAKRRRIANKSFFWGGFLMALGGSILVEEVRESDTVGFVAMGMGLGGSASLFFGMARSFKQATPSKKAIRAANAHNQRAP